MIGIYLAAFEPTGFFKANVTKVEYMILHLSFGFKKVLAQN